MLNEHYLLTRIDHDKMQSFKMILKQTNIYFQDETIH
jgi:hypothetical protein